MKNFVLFYVLLSLCFCSCNSQKKDSSPVISFITVEPGVQLELIDWGGKGEAILFLAGLGNTGHVFDEYAPQFTDDYHVMCLTRRGFGASGQPDTGYSASRQAMDILAVIDSLKIEKITLIGHSIAGEEMTKFAVLYPNRLNKLVYLDAAVDRTVDMSFMQNLPAPSTVTREDSASVKNVQLYLQRTFGVLIGESEIRAGCVFDKNERLIRDITRDSTYAAIMRSVERPEYEKIKATSLAIYSVLDSLREFFPYFDELDSTGQAKARELVEPIKSFLSKQPAKYKKELKNGQVLEIHGANHYVFISNPKEVTAAIRKFFGQQ